MAEGLDGKVVLITGAATGIGRASALAFAQAGAKLVLSDVAVEAAEATVADARKLGAEASFVRCDVAKRDQVFALVAAAVKQHGGIDCAFNNAGIEGTLRMIPDYPPETVEKVIAVNLLGVYWCLQAEIPEMVKRGGGAIVNTASVAGLIGAAAFSAYVASKHAVVGMSKTAAIECGKQGVRVNAICPGVIQTPMLDRLAGEVPGAIDSLAASVPIGRIGTAEEMADVVVWLCSPGARYVTGHALAADGGFVIQ